MRTRVRKMLEAERFAHPSEVGGGIECWQIAYDWAQEAATSLVVRDLSMSDALKLSDRECVSMNDAE